MNRSSLSSLQAALWLSPPPGETAAPNKQLQERLNKRVDYSEGKTGKLAQNCHLWERPQLYSLRSNILWLLKRGRDKENVRRENIANVIWVVFTHSAYICSKRHTPIFWGGKLFQNSPRSFPNQTRYTCPLKAVHKYSKCGFLLLLKILCVWVKSIIIIISFLWK